MTKYSFRIVRVFVRRNAHRKVMNSKYIDLCIIFVFNQAVHLQMKNQSFEKMLQ